MSTTEDALRAALEIPMKLRVALGYVRGLSPRSIEALESWLAEAATATPRPRFEVAISADLARLTWRRTVATDALAKGFEGIAGADELARLDAVIERVRPAEAGELIEAYGDVVDRGWTVPADVPLARALATADDNAITARLETFATAHDLVTCRRLARTVGAGNPFTELRIAVPGDGAPALAVALDAFGALGVPALAPAVREALRVVARPGVALSIWLTRSGLSRLGVVVPAPTTVDVLRLAGAAGWRDLDGLAAIEGALGVEAAATIECATAADGADVEIEYAMR